MGAEDNKTVWNYYDAFIYLSLVEILEKSITNEFQDKNL